MSAPRCNTRLVQIDDDLIQELADLIRQKAEDDDPDSEKSCKAKSFDGGMNLGPLAYTPS